MKKVAILLVSIFAFLCMCSVASAQTGWVKDGDYLFYFKDDTAVTGTQTIDGKVYIFANDGALKGNGKVQNTGYGIVYPGTDNKLMTGWQTVEGNTYYFNLNNAKAVTPDTEVMIGWKMPPVIDGISYLFNNDGVLVINDWWTNFSYVGPYFHSDTQGMTAFGYHKYGDYYYFFNEIGCSVSGFQTVDEQIHHFADNGKNPGEGYRETRGWKKIDKDWYFFSKTTGIMQTSSLDLDGYQYKFSGDGKLIITKVTIIFDGDKVRALDTDGEYLLGWQTINGNTYWFETDQYSGGYGAATTGTKYLQDSEGEEKHYYYFDEKGVMQTNLLVQHARSQWDSTNRYYYYGSDGKRISGWKTINGDRYYFDIDYGAYTGTVTIDSIIYTFSDEGKLLETVIPVTGVSLNKDNLLMKTGYSEKLVATVLPDDATNKKVSWSSSDTNVATVDSDGVVTARGAGSARITVKTEYGNKSATCYIQVKEVSLIEAYVTRCYRVILGRDPDPDGLNAWIEALKSGASAASEIIDGFVNSQEFLNKGLTKEQQVKVLYQAMLGRDPDPAGLAAWTDVLNQGYPFGSVINGFCGSTEFINLCNEYGIQPGSVNVGPVVPGPADDSSRGKIEAFVKRCYMILLERGVDPTGLKDWSDALENGVAQASQIIDGIVNSQEFQLRGLTNEQKVDCLYQAMLGRGADPDGRAAWVQALADGYPYAAIINGFCGSTEFINICNDYGIQPGSVAVKAAFVKREAITPEGEESGAATVYKGYNSEYINEEKIRAFVEHCYESVLGREGDEEGIANYMALIMNGKKTPKKVAYEFVFSPEFQDRLPGNEEFIRILYKLYLNREPGAEELAGWVEILEGGTGLGEIVNGFAESAEFKAIVREMKE